MCYSYATNFNKAKLKDRLNLEQVPAAGMHYFVSAFSRPLLPVITGEHSERIELMHWGLIPSWVKNRKQAEELSARAFNARGETLAEKPMFREAFRQHRCLVPAAGFYEWREQDGHKYPFFIKLAEDEVMIFGGLWAEWVDPETGELVHSFNIVTCAANDMLTYIHNGKLRMPLILDKQHEDVWLHGSEAQASACIKPYRDPNLEAFPVSKLASMARHNRDVPEVQEPCSYDELQLPWK
jgi:putative SOS response-associated peptidase YedK